jgi:hypothetical protein
MQCFSFVQQPHLMQIGLLWMVQYPKCLVFMFGSLILPPVHCGSLESSPISAPGLIYASPFSRRVFMFAIRDRLAPSQYSGRTFFVFGFPRLRFMGASH